MLTIFREVAIQWDLIAHTVLQQSLHGIGGLLGHTLRRLDPPREEELEDSAVWTRRSTL